MKYAEVAVNAPVAWPRLFTYALPNQSSVSIGCAVWVPFGPRVIQGIVLNLTDHSPVEETKEIVEVIGSSPLLSEPQITLARWIGDYYLAPYFEAASLMLPPAFERRMLTFIEPVPDAPEELKARLNPIQQKALEFAEKHGRVNARELEGKIAKKQIKPVLDRLSRLKLIVRSSQLEPPRVKDKLVSHVRLAVGIEQAGEALAATERRKSSRQNELLRLLIETNAPISLAEVRQRSGASTVAAQALVKKGLAAIEQVRVRRDPLAHRTFPATPPPELTPTQKKVWDEIRTSLQSPSESKRVFLLHGITGSGKTEIYLRALEETIRSGKKGIVLVPEIALTPQTIERVASRFPGRVAVLHSKLSLGEQFDEWHRIREGQFDVVIGSRSAVFAPQPNLGLIVIDEEHEWTYKQHEKTPLYHARDVALKLADLTGAVVVMGSATPDIESYHRAERGDYGLLELPERVGEMNGNARPVLPWVQIVDLRQELKQGNRSVFSRKLHRAIENALAADEQVILFLNRRGFSPFVQCRDCGHVMQCRRCEVALTHHIPEDELVCHICNYRIPPPDTCPECGKSRIKFLGLGTQKLEDETRKAFPQARILRWDRDVTKGKYSHEQILRKFQSHEADILIGTQMIAKGLDIPLVTLVGVINADIGLHLPDFRSGERTFQILSQVTGRAGRGMRGGMAIIQTFSPDHYAVVAAATHDFKSFYEREIAFRREHGYPPFNRLVKMAYSHTSAARCEEEAVNLVQALREERDAQGLANVTLIGPSPAYVQRVRGRYHWHVIVQGPEPLAVLSKVPIPKGWTVDVDPVGLT
ncbi:MAG: primosomal protein N' [Chloroflexi bacterium]|nr:primosomal protein N' [Chloroflexota bacterium]